MHRNQSLGLSQSPPDAEVEEEEGDEGQERGEGDPGPGGVVHDVALGQSQLGGSHVGLGVISTPTSREVQAEGDRLRLEELGEVEDDGEESAGDDVAQGSSEVAHQPVVRSGDGQEPLHCDGHHYEDAAAETQSVERVVKVGKYREESLGVKLLVVVPHHVQEGKHDVESIEHIQSNQQIVETNLLLGI